MAALTKKQKSLMSKHGEHHSAKHMQDMNKSMQQGKSAGTSRSKEESTISDKSYSNMKAGFPKKKKKSLISKGQG